MRLPSALVCGVIALVAASVPLTVGVPPALGGTAAAAAAPAEAVSNPWGTAKQVPGLAALPHYDGNALVVAVSCPAPGDCAAVGNYPDGAGGQNVFTVAEVKGAWQHAQELPVPPGLAVFVNVNSMSCPSAGNCGIGGYYQDSSGDKDAFVANEVQGTWHEVTELLSTEFLADENAEVRSISCPSPGNCAVGGDYLDGSAHRQAFVGDERNGGWEAAQEVPGMATRNGGGNAEVQSVSCATAGNCAAGGSYVGGSGNHQAFVVSERAKTWGSAREVAGKLDTNGGGGVNTISCPAPGYCSAGGVYSVPAHGGFGEAFVVSDTNYTWGAALEVPNIGKLNALGDASVLSVSCPSPRNCTAAGFYLSASSKYQGFVVGEQGGKWGNALQVPGTGALNVFGQGEADVVSCVSAGNCAVVGRYTDKSNHTQAFVTGEADGRWAVAEPIPGTIGLNKGGNAIPASVACASAVSCVVGGYYAATTATSLGFAAAGALPQTTRTALALSAAKLVYGHEQSERITVTVSPQRGGTPAGTVTVKAGSAVICTIALASGKGSCRLPARKLPVGKHTLTAAYTASVAFTGSASPAKTVTVAK